jgi:hypothetical protein
MDYNFVGPQDKHDQRLRRLRALELDHYAALITLEENPQDPLTKGDIAELERRIAHHRGVLTQQAEAVQAAESAEKENADQPSSE